MNRYVEEISITTKDEFGTTVTYKTTPGSINVVDMNIITQCDGTQRLQITADLLWRGQKPFRQQNMTEISFETFSNLIADIEE